MFTRFVNTEVKLISGSKALYAFFNDFFLKRYKTI